LIVCEGSKTEPDYFESLKKAFRLTTVDVKVVYDKPDPKSVVKRAEELREKRKISSFAQYDQIWCVIDVEAPQPHPTLDEAYDRAQKRGFNLALSNPCFEFWFLLHFERTSQQMTSKKAKQLVKKYLPDDDKDAFDNKLFPNTKTAISNASQL